MYYHDNDLKICSPGGESRTENIPLKSCNLNYWRLQIGFAPLPTSNYFYIDYLVDFFKPT